MTMNACGDDDDDNRPHHDFGRDNDHGNNDNSNTNGDKNNSNESYNKTYVLMTPRKFSKCGSFYVTYEIYFIN